MGRGEEGRGGVLKRENLSAENLVYKYCRGAVPGGSSSEEAEPATGNFETVRILTDRKQEECNRQRYKDAYKPL